MKCVVIVSSVLFFFFQAEDGIRDYKVTGVQTCALPIFQRLRFIAEDLPDTEDQAMDRFLSDEIEQALNTLQRRDAKVLRLYFGLDGGRERSEERRVGKEWGWGWGTRRCNRKREATSR